MHLRVPDAQERTQLVTKDEAITTAGSRNAGLG